MLVRVVQNIIQKIIRTPIPINENDNPSNFIHAPETVVALIRACPLAVVAFVAVDPHGRVLLWNRSAEQIYGWSSGEVIGKALPTVPPSGEFEFRTLLDAQLHGVSHTATIVQRQRKDGTLIDVSLWTAPLRDKQGVIRAKLAISADITEQRRAEQERLQLLESEKRCPTSGSDDGSVPGAIGSGSGRNH